MARLASVHKLGENRNGTLNGVQSLRFLGQSYSQRDPDVVKSINVKLTAKYFQSGFSSAFGNTVCYLP